HGAGHTVGCHTHSHKMLTSLSFDEACTEIATCKNVLESILRTEIAHFSYPFGMRRHFNEPLREFCKKIGFRTVANTTLSDSQRRIPLEADG
ncbi:MAG: polysaccharide deacetylase family protein, partial [Myxococcaceae bacterium]